MAEQTHIAVHPETYAAVRELRAERPGDITSGPAAGYETFDSVIRKLIVLAELNPEELADLDGRDIALV